MDSESKVEKPPQFMAAISLTCSARSQVFLWHRLKRPGRVKQRGRARGTL